MLVVVSPAKKLDFELPAKTNSFTEPEFLDESKVLVKHIKNKNSNDLQKLMKVSEKIADLNVKRFKEFKTPFTLENAKQAVFAFMGDTYVGLEADTLDAKELKILEKRLRILSGLYGLLRPMDLIQPYRLEMGTKWGPEKHKDLYSFWGDKLTEKINQDLKISKSKYLVNCASKEYFSAIKEDKLDRPVLNMVFKEKKGDDYKIMSLFAKRARGMMARFIAQNNITDIDDIKKFNLGSYKFNKSLSSENDFVFTRAR